MSQAAPAPFSIDAFENAPDPAAHFSAEGALLQANGAYRAAFPHALAARRPPWGRVSPPPFLDGARRFDAPAPDGRLYEWAERRLADGSRVAVARDVTDRARAAAEADRAKTALFATLTHELRTPLNGVLGMAGLMAQSRLDPEARDHLRMLRQSGEHLLDLINEVLDYSRLETGKLALDDAAFDAEAIAQSTAELLSPKAHEKGLEIAVVMKPGAPRVVRGDSSRFRQILFNLAGNAVKFTERGGVLIELGAGGGGRLKLVVRDSGPGVPSDKQSAIFEEFTQADASISRRYGGAGLGLAIVRKLARAMGGDVGVESRAGQGAAFWAELPLPAAVDAGIPAPRLEGLRVAILTPSEILARSLSAAIKEFGSTPTRIAHAGQAGDCDVVLIDQPIAANATEMTRALTSGPPVIVLAPQEDRDAIARHREAGVEHYVVKPVRRASLAERIRIALGREAGANESHDDRTSPPSVAGARVLLAEDNPVNALLARTILTRAGAIVDVVSDGAEAVAAAAAAPYDLIFLDLRMPRLGGVEAAQAIRAGPGASARAALIALTADAGEAERRGALAAGMDDFLTKPIDPRQLETVAGRFTRAAKPATLPRA